MQLESNGVSIVVCCYNSATRLPQTIKHIAEQQVPAEIPWELIIVDNNSVDETAYVALNEISKYKKLNFSYKIAKEETAGLSYARRKGVDIATYGTIIFCDDDNWLHDNYVISAYYLLKNSPLIGAACGQNLVKADINIPAWFFSYSQYYAVGSLSLDSTDISANGWIWGAGMVVRKSLLIKVYKSSIVNLTADRTKYELSTGGDVEICKWLLLMGYQLYFSTDLSLTHYIPEDRISLSYIKRLINSNKEISNLFHIYDFFINKKKYGISFKKILKAVCRYILSSCNLEDKILLYHLFKIKSDKLNIFYFKQVSKVAKCLK